MKSSTLTVGSSGSRALSGPRSDPRDVAPTTGQIFNVMRFSTHDGPGIRTTVFLKGCPLSCWWCHNPENWQHVPSEVYIADRCIDCGICIEACPNQALARTPQGITADPARCTHCGRCVDACPSEARERTGWPVTVPELVSTIERDIPFYEQSKGGVTFSGGEPLCQAEFLMAMLKACGQLEIHRAVDTCGYAASDLLLQVARFTDLFLFDLKALDPVTHRAETGVDNAGILANLKQLSGSGADIVIRIPLIPGVNDDEQQSIEHRRVHRRAAPQASGGPAALSRGGRGKIQEARHRLTRAKRHPPGQGACRRDRATPVSLRADRPCGRLRP